MGVALAASGETGKNATPCAVMICVAGLVRYSINRSPRSGLSAVLGIASPTTTARNERPFGPAGEGSTTKSSARS